MKHNCRTVKCFSLSFIPVFLKPSQDVAVVAGQYFNAITAAVCLQDEPIKWLASKTCCKQGEVERD